MKSCKCIPKGRYQWLGWSYSPLVVGWIPSWLLVCATMRDGLPTLLLPFCWSHPYSLVASIPTVSKAFWFPTSLVIFSPSSTHIAELFTACSPIFGSSQVYEFISIEGKVFLTTTKWLEKTSSFNRKYARKNHPKDHQKNTFVLLVHFALQSNVAVENPSFPGFSHSTSI